MSLLRLLFILLCLTTSAEAASIRGLAFDHFTATGPLDHVGRGYSDMMTTDAVEMLQSPEYRDCDIAVREVKKEAEARKELEFQKSPLVDPATRVHPDWIEVTHRVTADITTTADRLDWTIRVTAEKSGEVIASRSGTTDWTTGDPIPQLQGVLKDFLGKLCPKAYTLRAAVGEFRLNGVVCDVEKPWEMRPSGGFAGVTVRFTPSSRDGGDFRQSGKAYGWQWDGGGPYTIRWSGETGSFEARDRHTISAAIPAGKQQRDATLRGTLTPAPRCGGRP